VSDEVRSSSPARRVPVDIMRDPLEILGLKLGTSRERARQII